MHRGDLVTVALQGDAGKPRPALVIQADHFTTCQHLSFCRSPARSWTCLWCA
jgi:mRNA-degrading endonuclease toxin of MazEF toxin-antitoxin module